MGPDLPLALLEVLKRRGVSKAKRTSRMHYLREKAHFSSYCPFNCVVNVPHRILVPPPQQYLVRVCSDDKVLFLLILVARGAPLDYY